MQTDYQSQFKEALAQLNTAQKEAVNSLEGPVLVIAGPGTGKTQILAARIGNILSQTDAQAHNILCLTYTDAGTIAMRKRLLQFIGPEAYRVHIHTFHSFCNMVIQENLDYFGLRALEPLSELEKVEVLHEIIDEMDPKNPLKRFRGEVYYETGRLDKLFQVIKKENWSKSYLFKQINDYLQDLPLRDEFIYKRNGKDFKKGDVKQNKIDDETAKMQQLEAAIEAYEVYQKKLKKRQRYDFADMILWVLEAFQEDENLLRNYQEQYLYYLVDEFQDTSGSQSQLLHLLIDYWENPNVFVVGDDDQSIYAFQDANVRNILNFAEQYKDSLTTVMMKENYRSTQAILDVSGTLIERNTERLVRQLPGLNKDLLAAHPERKSMSQKPIVRTYYNAYHETVHVAEQIKKLHQEGKPLSEIAVIYRNHRQAEDIARYLQSHDIPLNIKKKINVLEQPLVEQVINILEYLTEERHIPHSGEHRLFHILHYPFFGLEPLDIARMAHEVSSKNYRSRQASFRDELAKGAQKAPSLFEQGKDTAAFKRVSLDIEYWIKESHNLTLQQLVEKIINRGGILQMALASPDKVWLMELIHSFFEFVKDECARNTTLDLEAFVQQVRLMQENRIEIPVFRVSYASEGVNFLTAHSSKGLEFEYVFLLGCDSKTWNGKSRSSTYKLPDTLTMKSEVNEEEEARRLFYVALTRAKGHLAISYADQTPEGKAMEKSAFVAEVESAGITENEFVAIPDEDLMDFEAAVLAEVELPELDLIDDNYLDELLKRYSMSVTHLNNYLKCPLSFYFDNLIRVPRAKSPAMTFGSSVHFALERLFKKMQESDSQTFPPVSEFLDDFAWYMKRNEDSFTPQGFELKMQYGKEILPKYYEFYIDKWVKVVSVERNMRNLEVRGVPINGKIDKIEFDGKAANLIDYKTGKYQNAIKKLNPPQPDKPEDKKKFEDEFGGDYWRQAVFYKILMDNDHSKDWQMVSAEFDFVEPDDKSGEFKKEKLFITDSDVAVVTKQIEESYKKIMAHEFEGCGEDDCDWCNFVKNHYRSVSDDRVPAALPED